MIQMPASVTTYVNKAEVLMDEGFTTKSAQKDTIDYLNRAYDKVRDVLRDKLYDAASAAFDRSTNSGQDKWIAFVRENDVPYGLHQVRDKHMSIFEKFECADVVKNLIDIREKAKNMPINKKETKAEATARKVAEVAVQDKTGKTRNIIADLVNPLKEDAIKKAVDKMSQRVESILAKLADFGMDINAYAPRPDSFNMGREEYKTANAKRAIASRITKEVNGQGLVSYAKDAKRFVERDEAGIERLLKEVADLAAVQFDEFVAKLVLKIGKCDDATLQGNFIWANSIITAVKGDTIEKWKTKTITNYSKFDLAFNQFPTRKVK